MGISFWSGCLAPWGLVAAREVTIPARSAARAAPSSSSRWRSGHCSALICLRRRSIGSSITRLRLITETGSNWLGWTDTAYYQGDCRYHAAGTGANTATWTFDGLDPTKTYQVYATWTGDSSHASNAPFTILDGTTTLATVQMNQQSAPDGRHDRRPGLAEPGHVPGRSGKLGCSFPTTPTATWWPTPCGWWRSAATTPPAW